jgi:hypothetical protein
MWRFYLLSCAGAFRARSLNVFSILFSKEDTARTSSPQRVRRMADADKKETKLDAAFHAAGDAKNLFGCQMPGLQIRGRVSRE